MHFKTQKASSPGCPHCGTSMRFARTIAGDSLPDLQAFQCDLCGLAISGEAVAEALEVGRAGWQLPGRLGSQADIPILPRSNS